MPCALRAASDVTVSTAVTSGGAFGGTTTKTFTPSAASANVNRDDIQTFLDAGTAVVIETASGQASPGDITVNSAVTKSAGGVATLTLTAARHITLNQGIVLTAGTLSLSAQGTLTVGAALPVQSPGTINAVGGITLQGTATMLFTLDLTTSQLGTNGAATVAGALAANFANDFEDAIDGTFSATVVQAVGGVSGTFTGQPPASRLTLPNDHGSLRVNYAANAVTLDDWQPLLHDLNWDPGTTDAGTQAFSNSGNTRGGRHYFKVTAQATDIGAWRTRLAVANGEAHVYLKQGSLPTTSSFDFKSERAGSDGIMLRADQFNTAEEWFILVDATDGAQWSLVSGRAFVENLGTLGFTDANFNSQYDIGEAVIPTTSGGAMPPEGIRFLKATVPTGTPAWSLWLSGSTREIAVRKTQVPFPDTGQFDKKQSGKMLLVPTYLGTGTGVYFLSISADPGESITLDSRIQQVTDMAFDSTVSNVSVPGPPYRVYRVQVPIQQIAWDVSTTAVSGNPDLVVRENNVGAEFDNDGYSEATGSTTDSVTLVPNGLSDGTWFITVHGIGAYEFTLRNGEPVITTISFTDLKTNDQPTRAGWRYYKLTDVPSQLGSLGWELELANQVPGTEIAIRRNAVPGRWLYRANGSSLPSDLGFVDYSSTEGFIQRPGHQADIWYVGVYTPQQALGAFQLDVHPITPTTVTFNNGTQSVSNLAVGRFRYFRVDVPNTAGILGWDVRVRDVTSGTPQLVVRRDVLPESVGSSGFGSNPSEATTWASGNSWAGSVDWTGRSQTPGGGTVSTQRLVAGMGRPLEPGTYYIGVFNAAGFTPDVAGFTFESRGIGTGQAFPISTLAFTGGSSVVSALTAREAQYFKVTIPSNTPSWELTLAPSSGEMLLAARRSTVPDFNAAQGGVTDAIAGTLEVEMQKTGPERFTLFAPSGENFITPGDYFLAVVSEGQNPSGDTVGTGTASGTLTSLGTLAVTNLGTITETATTQSVAPLEGGRVKAFQFNVTAGTASIEIKLTNRVGNPQLYVLPGSLLPESQHFGGSDYGVEGGSTGTGWANDDEIVTLVNPAAGIVHVTVRAEDEFGGALPDASATLEVRAVPPTDVAFNGGTAVVTGHTPGTWKFFRVDVPNTAGIMGWDLRLRSVTAGTPKLVVRRDTLPDALATDFGSAPHTSTTWPSGSRWAGGVDWTGYMQDPDTSSVSGRRLVAGMGRPLEAGTYYIGVFNESGITPTDAAYTLESRGIGAGQVIPVDDITTFSGGNATVTALAAREAAYFKVTVPANTPSWEVSLAPSVGDMLLIVRRGTIPDFFSVQDDDAGAVLGSGLEVEMQKTGAERYTMMPPNGENFITTGDYYLAVVSEGVSPSGSFVGTGSSSGTVTSHGALGVASLGEISLAETNQAVSLVGGQVKAFQFTVPAGAYALEARLDNRTGGPHLYLHQGTRLPRSWIGLAHDYGIEAGSADAAWATGAESPVTLSSPAAGQYRLTVRAEMSFGSDIPDATAMLVLRLLPAPGNTVLAFNGGTSSETGHAANTWRYFQVTVPAGVDGWDIRVRNVTAGTPTIVVRRDELPTTLGTDFGGYPERATSWPTGAQWAGLVDWTGYSQDPGGASVSGRRLVAGMGRPLETGTYLVGVFNSSFADAAAYTIESRGIGSGQMLPVTALSFTGGNATINNLAPREAVYFKISIAANTPSWEFTLDPSLGDMLVALRRGTVPDFAASEGGLAGDPFGGSLETRIAKDGAERYVMLPPNGQTFLTEGDYFIAVVSEGQNPDFTNIGTGNSTGVLNSLGVLAVTDLGSSGGAGISQAVSLVSGQVKAYEFTAPGGIGIMEMRLDNRTGDPGLFARPGTSLPTLGSYGSEGGAAAGVLSTEGVLTLFNPTTGTWRLIVRAGGFGFTIPDATADLVLRPKTPVTLNFSSTQNGNGFSHTDTKQLADAEHEIYSVAVPTTVSDQPVLGWKLTVNHTQGDTTLRIYKDISDTGTWITITDNTAIIVPPYFTPGDTWFVDVIATGLTNYTLTSAPVTLAQPAWTMPATQNQTFADTGTGLPGDQGTDLGQDDWHFYAIDVPSDNLGLLRTELQAINGNPDLYIRETAVPTTLHGAAGQPFNWSPLVDRSLNGSTTEHGNWVPLNGRTANALPAGRWYLGVRAAGGSNARYRLIASTGQVQDLSLTNGSVTDHTLAGGDWRYYRFTVPDPAPANWTLTFTQQVGDVVMWVRDTIPPGQGSSGGIFSSGIGWATDAKNQGPYDSGNDPPAAYTFTTPPLRPGTTYYAGFQAKNDATFSLTSATSGGNVVPDATLDFYSGTFNGNVPGNSSLVFKVVVPPEAIRWKHTSTHSDDVQVRLEQGTIPTVTGNVHFTGSGPNSSLNQPLSPTEQWPWRASATYYVRLVNTAATAEAVVFNLNGANAANLDDDNDGLPDVWETSFFGGTFGQDADDDSDLDGLLNLTEFAFNLNPTISAVPILVTGTGTTGLPLITTTFPGGSPRLRVEYIRRTAATAPQLDYTVEFTGNLTSWLPATGTENVTSIDANWERVVIEDTGAPGGSARRFGRVVITQTP
ncbi:hypothetical protein [Prosthecobacter sp.]|uniref:hypothetical protein n=1 Tax=Prosthecobacter sp. TaxID=1965333 RepID=UPI002AC969BF|nr:hypothetical protein [Prosthecobacter sp.]